MYLTKKVSDTQSLMAKINFLTTDFGSASAGRKIIFKYFIDQVNVNAETASTTQTNLSESGYLDCECDEDGGDIYTQAYNYMLTLSDLSGYSLVEA